MESSKIALQSIVREIFRFILNGVIPRHIKIFRIRAKLKWSDQLIERISFAALLKANYRETNKLELTEILETLEGMKVVKLTTDIDTFTGGKKILFIEWIGDPTKVVQISNDLSEVVECPAE